MNEPECSICMVTPEASDGLRPLTGDDWTTTKCGHTYHQTCLNTWMTTNQTCPLCRTELDAPHVEMLSRQHVEQAYQIGNLGTIFVALNADNEASFIRFQHERQIIRLPRESSVMELDVELIMNQTGVSREVATEQLRLDNGDVVQSIMTLSN